MDSKPVCVEDIGCSEETVLVDVSATSLLVTVKDSCTGCWVVPCLRIFVPNSRAVRLRTWREVAGTVLVSPVILSATVKPEFSRAPVIL